MYEIAELTIFETQGILPGQFFPSSRDAARIEPFRRLALAVLLDAVNVFQTNSDAVRPGRRAEFNEARDWLLGPRGHGPFAFENVCFLLDLDTWRLRNWLREWQVLNRTGEKPKRLMARRSPVDRGRSIQAKPSRRAAALS